MLYVCHTRFKEMALCGKVVNIPATSILINDNGILTWNGMNITYYDSENAHLYFSTNVDGKGMERGKLVKSIVKSMQVSNKNHKAKREKVYKDPICLKYCRGDVTDAWIWNHNFYNAPIEDLVYINNL